VELDAPLSPRSSHGIDGWASDTSAVYIDEREEVGRYLRAARPIRHGEAILVEEPLFMSPASPDEIHELMRQALDPSVIAAGAQDGTPFSLSVSAQLSLVVALAFIQDGNAPNCEEFRQLQGDTERWRGPATTLWSQMREELRAQISEEAMSEIFSIVATNAHESEHGRAGLFNMGSYAEHSCMPSGFKEVLTPVERAPTRPCSPDMGGQASPHAVREFVPTSQPPRLVIRAQRDIACGEIISLSYISEYLPTWKRRELLQQGYGFFCRCNRCMLKAEAVCAFRCPRCDDGPVSPLAAVNAPDGYKGCEFRCESCGVTIAEGEIEAFTRAELDEALSPESTAVLHPYHHKIIGVYLHNLQAIPAHERIQAIEQIIEAQRRLTGNLSHPILGRLCENLAAAYMEVRDWQQANVSYRRAQELYAISHRGPPDSGHDLRCFQMQTQVAGPLGPVPRSLSRLPRRSLAKSPSLPSLAEDNTEDAAPGS